MDPAIRQEVRKRASYRCEYCQLRQDQEPLPFHVEHITPRQHGGGDALENLALACPTAICTKDQISPGWNQIQGN